jgi:uncharacterized membrane protein
MPFCSQCGTEVGSQDAYCGRCGARQPLDTTPPGEFFSQISPRTASICCYIPGLGWIASIIVLASQRFRKNNTVRFHAFQGLYLFVAWLLDDWVLRPVSLLTPHVPLHQLVQIALLIMSVFMMVKAAHDEAYSLPLFGELAQRSISEE